ncbi:MAG TPA: L,D-transpeptidase family protein [Anaerolineales bacterium]|nr:L,D-transpeptidase family protein [Anaerolineales bacterium]
MACAAAAPAIQRMSMATATPDNVQVWALAQIPKPSPTESLAPTAQPTDASPMPTTDAPAATLPVLEPTATGDTSTSEAEGAPQITMEIVSEDPQPAPAPDIVTEPGSNGKYILVSLSEQHLYAYDNGQLIYSFVASTGMGNSTRVGTFRVQDKIPNAYGANWNIWMPNWMGIYWSGTLENGIHALPILPGGGRLWAGYLGTPISYGCVVLGVDESLQLYDWADVGTPVEIRW